MILYKYKPKLKYVKTIKSWKCTSKNGIVGFGRSIHEAYWTWAKAQIFWGYEHGTQI